MTVTINDSRPVSDSMMSQGLSDTQKSILLLWQRVNTSLSAYHKLSKHFGDARLALQSSPDTWRALKIHAKHITRHVEASAEYDIQFLAHIEHSVKTGEYGLLFLQDERYPLQLAALFDPPPVLFVRGNIDRLNQSQIAIVGSRKPTPSAQKLTFDMAQYLAKSGYIITSGLAQGVDAQAHMGALSQPVDCAGRTVGVMGTGIDVCYPKQHQALFDRIVKEGGCIISELLPGTLPNKHTFPRRNRLVAGLSLGTIVTEAQIKSGSMITARLTSDQGKQVFAMPSTVDNLNAQGCHHLIREGATLIYHPEQVVSDLSHQLVTPIQRQHIKSHSESLTAQAAEFSIPNSVQHPVQNSSAALNSAFNDTSKTISAIKKPSNTSQPIEPIASAFMTDVKSSGFASMPLGNQATLSQQTSLSNQAPVPKVSIPSHLQPLWTHIDFDGQDLDILVRKTQIDTSTLLSQLMELELLGSLVQIGGRYKRI